jgi:uncharacterized protein (AIM24 family)
VTAGLARKASGGDTLFHQFYTAKESGDVVLAPSKAGDIAAIELDGGTEYYVKRPAFLAATSKVHVATATKGLGLVCSMKNSFFP